MPNVYYLIEDRFMELYSINRQLYVNKTYQEFFVESGDYYDQMMILIILAQTFNDLVVEVPEWYIRRDIFDIRSCRYFLETNGVAYFNIIPLKYQIRIVKNLNKLIKYKSSTKNIHDILDVFDVKGMEIFKYWIYKKFVGTSDSTPVPDPDEGEDDEDEDVIVETIDDGTFNFGDIDEGDETAVGDYDFGELGTSTSKATAAVDDYDFNFLGEENNLDPLNPDIPDDPVPDDQYELEFIKSPIEESYDDYIRNSSYRDDYYSVTTQDKFWNGGNNEEYIKKKILAEDFTIHGTKFMGVEYNIPMDEYLYQMEYFLGLLLNSNVDTSDIVVNIPTINDLVSFKVSHLFLFLMILTAAYNRDDNDDSTIIRYENVWQGTEPTIDPTDDHFDWKKKVIPEVFIRKEGRVHAYNVLVDKEALIETLRKRHSHLRFGDSDNFDLNPVYIGDDEYKARTDEWINDMGVFDFLTPDHIDNTIDLMDTYKANKVCHDKLKELMLNADNEDDLKTYQYVYQELYTVGFDAEIYKLSDGSYANDLVDLLRDKNYVLYQKYYDIMNESSIESRQDVIRGVMNDILDTLDYYLGVEGLEYIFSFTSVESFESIVQYLNLMIGFFKSYKVYFLDPYIAFHANDKLENTAKAIDVVREWEFDYYHYDKALISDCIAGVDEELYLVDDSMLHTLEVIDIYSYYDPDPLSDQDYNGYTAEELDEYEDIDGRYADDLSTYPYTMINAGTAYEGIININNINGGYAQEDIYEIYYDIDGGYEYHRDDEKTDQFGSQMFNYIIDGGGAGSRWFCSNTMDFELLGTEFISNVIVSDKPKNVIKVLDDGLFLSTDDFLDETLFEAFIASVNVIVGMIQTEAIEVAEDIEVLTDEDLLKRRIKRLMDSYMYYIDNCLDLVIGDPHPIEKQLKNYIDTNIQSPEERYNSSSLNPYAWEELG